MVRACRCASRRTALLRCEHRSLDPRRPARSLLAIVGMNGSVHPCTLSTHLASYLSPEQSLPDAHHTPGHAESRVFTELSEMCRICTPPRNSAHHRPFFRAYLRSMTLQPGVPTRRKANEREPYANNSSIEAISLPAIAPVRPEAGSTFPDVPRRSAGLCTERRGHRSVG